MASRRRMTSKERRRYYDCEQSTPINCTDVATICSIKILEHQGSVRLQVWMDMNVSEKELSAATESVRARPR